MSDIVPEQVDPAGPTEALQRRRVRVTGTVQGVGFRPFVYRHAVALGLRGWVGNDSRGVLAEIEGPAACVAELCRRLVDESPPLARVDGVECAAVAPLRRPEGFRIVPSDHRAPPSVAVGVDTAACAACLAEVGDPDDRRHGYPFTNCTDCGPRYTIAVRVPYDRQTTTMRSFPMCDTCRAEYEDPASRRFHAEPNACPVCGPRLRLRAPNGAAIAEGGTALRVAAALLRHGAIVAVKGLGGYHLAVDAADAAVVDELRRRKQRDAKPFAVMVRDVGEARELCHLDTVAEAALASPRRPIVLAPARPGARVAPGVAPGLLDLGLLLPYTPLHHLLLGAAGRALVMTSGNLSDEPIAHDDGDALARLGPVVDALLTHDRAIHIRCDDSVAAARGGRLQLLRRSRGYAPEPLSLPAAARRPLLAVGGQLKATVSVARDGMVVASHHIGDLELPATWRSFTQAVEHLCHLYGVAPALVAHDLHPEYLSTKWARDSGLETLAVQHHHAHVASCLVDHGRSGPVVGVAFDGHGYGPDGRLWGGEVLLADLEVYERLGHLRAVPLAGGTRAIREPWRMAVVWALAALGPDGAAAVGRALDDRWDGVVAVARAPRTLTTTSAGRLFDAVAALLGVRRIASYEGQAAVELEALARSVPRRDAPRYPTPIDGDDAGQLVLDPAPLVAAIVAARRAGVAVPVVAAGFHESLGRATAAMAARAAAASGVDAVVLTGGVFQNGRFSEVVETELRDAGLQVLVHERVPANDGGISIGQAAIAARRTHGCEEHSSTGSGRSGTQ